MVQLNGLIVKSLGGFYYVKVGEEIIECRAKGAFRNEKIKPVVGDNVMIETDGKKGMVSEIMPRKNEFLRPPLANIDALIFVLSTTNPPTNTLVVDKLIAIAEYKEIEPIIVITKTDLKQPDTLKETYQKAGFRVVAVESDDEINEIKDLLKGKTSAFIGNSGVGKSTLLNKIDNRLTIKTADISQKLGRGKHTTRDVELYMLENGGVIADTPGFSSIEIERYDIILKDQLQYCFREFEKYIGECKFKGCLHQGEKGCKVLNALEKNEISSSRYESYLGMLNDAKKINLWEIKK